MSASTLIPDNLLTLPTEEFKKQFREYQKQFRKRFGVPRPRKNRPSRLKCPHLSHPAPIYGPEVDPYIAGAAEARTMPISAQSQDGLSDREALKLYPGFIGPGDLPTWREMASKRRPCQWIGRPFHAWKVPSSFATPKDEGEWRNSPQDLAEIVQAMKDAAKADGSWVHPATGKKYLAMRPFMALTGMCNSEVRQYRDHLHHTAIGGFNAYERVPIRQRRNRWGKNYVYLEDHGKLIAAFKRARTDERNAVRRLIRESLGNGGWEFGSVIKKKADDAGIGLGLLRSVRKEMKVKWKKLGLRGPTVWWLRGKRPPKYLPVTKAAGGDGATFSHPIIANQIVKPETTAETESSKTELPSTPAQPIPTKETSEPTPATTADPPPKTDQEQAAKANLPRLAPASELARLIGQPVDAVESFLRRYRVGNWGCFQSVENPRRNEPRILYRTAVVWQPLQDHFAK
jgi:hypothetical protein